SILNALFRRGGDRAFWAGFALFGWAYLILNFAPLAPSGLRMPSLILDPGLEEFRKRAHPDPEYIPNPKANRMFLTAVTMQMEPDVILRPGSVVWTGSVQCFQQVGHSLGALAFGLLGGFWGRRAYGRREEATIPGAAIRSQEAPTIPGPANGSDRGDPA